MQGVRLPDGVAPKNAGEYSWMPYDEWTYRPPYAIGDGEWHIIDPTGHIGAVRATDNRGHHTWEIHDDGTVTFTPSLVMPAGWHGFLTRGVFS
jgi:hypothetical protein